MRSSNYELEVAFVAMLEIWRSGLARCVRGDLGRSRVPRLCDGDEIIPNRR